MTRAPLLLAAATAALFAAVPVSAALQVGDHVPSLITQGALAGRTINLNLQQELRKGPVVLYFFPKAFTPGCSAEAKAFAESIDEFKAAGAQVFGLSGDKLEDLEQFSLKDCAGAFPVAMASPSTIQAFDVAFAMNGQRNDALSNRTSYVIAQDGRIVMVHSDLNWQDHVATTLAAVRALHRS